MTHHIEAQSVQEIIRRRVRDLRRRHNWRAQDLSDALAGQGIRWSRATVAAWEAGKRAYTTVQELIALAYVLDTSPLNLMVQQDDESRVTLRQGVNVEPSLMRKWVRGQRPLPGQDSVTFHTEGPVSEMRGEQS